MTRSPISVCVIEQPAPIVQSRPIKNVRPDYGCCRDDASRSNLSPWPNHNSRINRNSASKARSWMNGCRRRNFANFVKGGRAKGSREQFTVYVTKA